MRCSGWLSLAISVCSALALVLAAPAAAHVTVSPPFVSAGDTTTLSFAAPNERDADMTGFAVSFPGEFRVVEARSIGGWQGSVEVPTATWDGGRLGPGLEVAFIVEVEGPAAPGPATLDVEQRYPGGEVVRWGVSLTVTPAAETPSQNLGWALVTALVGFVVITVIGVAMMRRARSLQEK